MTPLEATALCRLAKAMCPQQAVDELTPDAWHLLLDDLTFEDAKAALVIVCKQRPFVAPAEIRTEVRRMRRDRITHAEHVTPPSGLDADGYLAWRRQVTRALADGQPPPTRAFADGQPPPTEPTDAIPAPPHIRQQLRALTSKGTIP